MIGVAFDGTGYGTDGTIWGGEFLIAGLADFDPAGRLALVPMQGGAAADRQPWRMAAVYLEAARQVGMPSLEVERRNERHWASVMAMARRGIDAPVTSSAGPLFDAVAALLGLQDEVNYEGQAAIELEQLADPAEAGRTGPRSRRATCSSHRASTCSDVRPRTWRLVSAGRSSPPDFIMGSSA